MESEVKRQVTLDGEEFPKSCEHLTFLEEITQTIGNAGTTIEKSSESICSVPEKSIIFVSIVFICTFLPNSFSFETF